MLDRLRRQHAGCTHDEIVQPPGTAAYGLARQMCRQCGRIFVSSVHSSSPGALFQSREAGALAVNTGRTT